MPQETPRKPMKLKTALKAGAGGIPHCPDWGCDNHNQTLSPRQA